MGIVLFQKTIYQSHRSGAINIIIAINQNLFLVVNGFTQSVDGRVHILHQKRIMKVRQLWPEESPGFIESMYAPLYQYTRNLRPHVNGLSQLVLLNRRRLFLKYPPIFHSGKNSC